MQISFSRIWQQLNVRKIQCVVQSWHFLIFFKWIPIMVASATLHFRPFACTVSDNRSTWTLHCLIHSLAGFFEPDYDSKPLYRTSIANLHWRTGIKTWIKTRGRWPKSSDIRNVFLFISLLDFDWCNEWTNNK